MKNIANLMKQAQQMQSKMAELQADLEREEVTGMSGGGLVKVTINGKNTVKKVTIDPKAVDLEDLSMLEDLIAAAANDAKTKLDAVVKEKTKSLMSGMSLPEGMNLPL